MTTATDLLEKMLELDVDKRLTASQALAHPFFEPFRDPEEETEAQQPLDDSLEREKLTVDEWKRKGRAPQRLPRSLQPVSSAGLVSPPGVSGPGVSPGDCGLSLSEQTLSPACASSCTERISRSAPCLLGEGGRRLPSAPTTPEPPCLPQSTSTRRS